MKIGLAILHCVGSEAKDEKGEPPPKHGFFRTALRGSQGGLRMLRDSRGSGLVTAQDLFLIGHLTFPIGHLVLV